MEDSVESAMAGDLEVIVNTVEPETSWSPPSLKVSCILITSYCADWADQEHFQELVCTNRAVNVANLFVV